MPISAIPPLMPTFVCCLDTVAMRSIADGSSHPPTAL